ncbi:hypothetical protein EPUS_07288 [Endocarpon pusillum Z07020]|uniref:peptidylprolyl isomerase n=1 Tax=Endocarpon pusillum (strain Z07020 / HMAS-L-300199) TaxID=1263415 RepID=U1GBP5_ENDPU|nr:uncharacterized protein EPUS_07288 [Endocarpon pusillum Z07020]ERF69473.1 hypothetical protein EPUS_07288 [Endocarpon pusillum Z07020]
MSGTQPVAVYAMKVPAGDVMVPAVPDFAAMFRLSMAAIDPTAEPEFAEGDEKKTPRATLKLIRVPAELFGDDDSEDSDYDEMEGDEVEESSSEEEEVNGGPSDPSKAKKPNKLDLVKAIAEQGSDDEEEEDDSEEEAAAKSALMKIMKGKGKATENGEEADDDEDSLELEEVVICTLDPEKHYQQPLDIVVGEDEKIFFKVSGTHEVHLTGNYVIPIDDGQARLYGDEEEDDYDLSPDEDELDALEDMEDEEESDELDDMADPRVMEVDTDEEAPKLVEPATKGKNKRPAEDSDEDEANLDDIMSKSIKPSEPTTNGDEKPLSKSQKKKLKKLKKNDGEAAPVETPSTATSKTESKTEKKEAASNGEKKVQFAKNLEQGPTPSATPPSKDVSKDGSKETPKETKQPGGSLGVKDMQGVTVDDRKLGSGPQAKKGSHVEMRYIGKLENGKVFDANKKGKPFSFRLGAGEVIKGWDIGVMGMAVGGERRLTIPANLGYGSKGAPPKIPPNSKLIFDLKVLGVK